VARALLLPIWVFGVFAQAVVRVVVAVNDALRAADADSATVDGADADDAEAVDDARG